MEKLILLVLAMVALTGCATIVSGTSSTVDFTSVPTGVQVQVEDVKRGHRNVANCVTPCTVELKKGNKYFGGKNYLVKASKEGYTPMELELNSNFNWWYAGNLLFGGLIGILIVDPLTGAMWLIPDLDVQMKQEELKAAKVETTNKFNYTYVEFLRLMAFEAEVLGVVDIPGPPTFASAALSSSDKHILLKSKIGETILIDRVPNSVGGTYCGTVNSSLPIKVGESYTFPAVLQPKSDCINIR